MSHFLTFVLVGREETDVAGRVREGLVPYAVVTPEGVWVDCERKGTGAWAVEVSGLLRRYADCLVVAVDCHC